MGGKGLEVWVVGFVGIGRDLSVLEADTLNALSFLSIRKYTVGELLIPVFQKEGRFILKLQAQNSTVILLRNLVEIEGPNPRR